MIDISRVMEGGNVSVNQDFSVVFDALCILHLLSKNSITAMAMKSVSLALLLLALQGTGTPPVPPKWF